jgi:hypothetical protein
MDDLITTTTIFSPKTNKKTFTKVNLNNANFGEFMRIILQKCEAKAKRTTKLFMRSEAKRIRFASLFFALMRIRNANLDPWIQYPPAQFLKFDDREVTVVG